MMTDHQRSPPGSSTLRQSSNAKKSSSKSKRSGGEGEGEKEEKTSKSSSGDKKPKKSAKKEKKEDDNNKIPKKSSSASKSKLSKSTTSTSSSKAKSSHGESKSKVSSSKASGTKGKSTRDKEKKKSSSSKEKGKSSKKDKNGSSNSLKKEAKKASKSSQDTKSKSKTKDKSTSSSSKDNHKKSSSSKLSTKAKAKSADSSKTSDSSKENTQQIDGTDQDQVKKGKSPRRVSFEVGPDADDHSHSSGTSSSATSEHDSDHYSDEDSLDISGDISSGSGESFALSDDEGSDTDQHNNSADLHASARVLPSVALKALQAMAALKHVEPAAFEAEPKKDSSILASPNRPSHSRRASVGHADMTVMSPLVQKNPEPSGGMDWDKLNRRLTYKHIKKPETKIDSEKKMASEQTGKFFQLIQQQHEGSDAEDPNLKLLSSAVEQRAKTAGYSNEAEKSSPQPQKRIPRSARIKKSQGQQEELDSGSSRGKRMPRVTSVGQELDSSSSAGGNRLPPRMKSADPKLGKSLSAISATSKRVRRNKSSDSCSKLSFDTSNSRGSKNSVGSSSKGSSPKMEESSRSKGSSSRLGESSRSSHNDERAARRKQQREAFHKSFSSHDHLRPSARRRKKAEDATKSLNMSLSSGMHSRVRRHKSEDDVSFATSASTNSRNVRRNKSLDDDPKGHSRGARKKFSSSTNSPGVAAARLCKEEPLELGDDQGLDGDLNLELNEEDDFGFVAPEHDEFVSMHEIVKREGKRYSIWD